jgi:hypothetical protein
VHYDFKSINIKSAGARADDSDDPIENLSASKMRAHAQGGDHESFHAGMPKGYSTKHSQQLMQDVLKGMTPPPKKSKKKSEIHEQTLWEYAPKLDYDAFRNHYMLDHIFKVGALVEHDDSGLRGKVVHRGTNYVIFEMPDGSEHRAWLQHVSEVNEPTEHEQEVAADTTKDQSNYSADDGSGNTWKVGTDAYRMALQDMTPGQATKKFSQFNTEIRKTAATK